MKFIIKLFILMICMEFCLSACTDQVFSDDSFMAPTPAGMGKPAKDAPPDYTEGWNDGCKTGLSTMNQGYYKSFYTYKQNYKKADNLLYYQAWKDAYTYCRQYSFRYTWDALDRRRNQGLLSVTPLCVLCPNEVR